MPLFYATTNRGLEDVAAHEVEELIHVKPRVGVGRVSFQTGLGEAIKLILAARTIHRVVLVLLEEKVATLNDVYRAAASIEYADLIARSQSFAVRAERIGVHDFTSLDVAAKVGQAVIDSYRQGCGHRLRVDLKNPDVIIRCIIKGEELTLGIDLTGASLHMRNYRVYNHPAALRTTIAASMVKLAGWDFTSPLLDPMCGGGTIVIEAALMARRVPPGMYRRDLAYRRLAFINQGLEVEVAEELVKEVSQQTYPIHGLDCSARHVEGAKLNAASAGVADTVRLEVGDVFRLAERLGYRPSTVVTNPPYGLRSGPSLKRIAKFYEGVLRSLRKAASGAKVVLITASQDKLSEAAKEVKAEVEWTRQVMHGRLQSYISALKL